MAYTSVTLGTGTTLQGAALANTGDVTMETNTISNTCVTAPITTTSTTTSSGIPGVPEFPIGFVLAVAFALPVALLLMKRLSPQS